ncbi:MAG: hypothetical protein Q9162_000543 [Coniocarpon cinnabarinum]
MVADAVIYHPTVSHYLKFVATTVGRDKVMRLLQYFARFYAWYLYRTNNPPSSIAPFEALKKHFGLIRKSLRLGKSVEHLKAAAQAYDAKPSALDPILRFCAIGRQLGYAGYMFSDNVHFIHATGIQTFEKSNAARWQERAYRAWFAGLTCNVVAGLYQLVRLGQRERGIDRKEGEGVVESKRVERERSAVRLQLLSDVCDLSVPVYGLGWGGGVLDDGLVGLAGVCSSAIGIWSVWQKTG